jgi:anti-sigma28 factor (negative regulator of flagellin synthesis)
MKVEAPSSIREIDKVAPPVGRSVDNKQTDRVTMDDGAQAAALVRAAAAGAGVSRSARLSQLEAGIRNGSYRPSASQIAEQLLSSAEVDARLQVMLSR